MPTKRTPRLAVKAMIGLLAISVSSHAQADDFGLYIGASHSHDAAFVRIAEEKFIPSVESRVSSSTNHTISFKMISKSDIKPTEFLESVQDGRLDIGIYCVCFEPVSLSTLNLIGGVPFITDDARLKTQITNETIQKFPQIGDFLTTKFGQILLSTTANSPFGLATSFNWETLSELKGRKIGASGPNIDWIEMIGAQPIRDSIGYDSISTSSYLTGVDAVNISLSNFSNLKLTGFIRLYTQTGWGATSTSIMTVNAELWNRLPMDVQTILREEAEKWGIDSAIKANEDHTKSLSRLTASGARVQNLSFVEKFRFAKMLLPWVKQNSTKLSSEGYPGVEMYSYYVSAAYRLGAKIPYNYDLDGKASVAARAIGSRIFLGPHNFPPQNYTAYGIVAFQNTPTPNTREKFLNICYAYLSSLPYISEVSSESKQLVTVWPLSSEAVIQEIDVADIPAACNSAVKNYHFPTSLSALDDAGHSGANVAGEGPYLLAWAPASSKGKKDILVLRLNLSDVTNETQAMEEFRHWRYQIERDSKLWGGVDGWEIDRLRREIRNWVDRHGSQMLELIPVK